VESKSMSMGIRERHCLVIVVESKSMGIRAAAKRARAWGHEGKGIELRSINGTEGGAGDNMSIICFIGGVPFARLYSVYRRRRARINRRRRHSRRRWAAQSNPGGIELKSINGTEGGAGSNMSIICFGGGMQALLLAALRC
jgi:hypothetical protein